VNYEIVELSHLSGNKAKIYSILPKGRNETLFDEFLKVYQAEYPNEINEIVMKLKQIGCETGARDIYFKHEGDNEFKRKNGEYVYRLYEKNGNRLRLYCIKFSSVAIIIGGGGYKDKSIRKWQDDEKLAKEVKQIMNYCECIFKQLSDGDLYWSIDHKELEGNFKNYEDE